MGENFGFFKRFADRLCRVVLVKITRPTEVPWKKVKRKGTNAERCCFQDERKRRRRLKAGTMELTSKGDAIAGTCYGERRFERVLGEGRLGHRVKKRATRRRYLISFCLQACQTATGKPGEEV